MKLNLETIQSNSSNTLFKMNLYGDLEVNLNSLKITASSDSNSKFSASEDKEGADTLNVKVQSTLNNDLSSKINTNVDIKVNITPEEQEALKKKLKILTGQELELNGIIEVTDIQASAELNSDGQVKYITNVPGKIKVKDLNLLFNQTKLNLNSAYGEFEANQKDNNIILRSKNINITGKIDSKTSLINIKDLKINQELILNLNNPEKFELAPKGQGNVALSGDFIDKKTGSKISIENLQAKGIRTLIDTNSGTVAINSEYNSNISFDKLQIPSYTISNFNFTGNLNIDTNKGLFSLKGNNLIANGKIGKNITFNNLKGNSTSVDIDLKSNKLLIDATKGVSASKINISNGQISNAYFKGKIESNIKTGITILYGDKVSFDGKLGDIDIKNLTASGKVIYDPENGITIKQGKLRTSGKVGDFDITKLKGNGDIIFDKYGNLVLADTSDIEFDSSTGLSVKGDLKVGYKNGKYNFITNPSAPITINYQHPTNPNKIKVSNLSIDGNLLYDTKTGILEFNNKENKLEILDGQVDSVTFNKFKIDGQMTIKNGIVNIINSKEALKLSGNLAGIDIGEIRSNGSFIYDDNNSILSITKLSKLSLSKEKIDCDLQGNIDLNYDDNKGTVELISRDGLINGKVGDIVLKDFKLDGKLLYDTRTKTLLLQGYNNNELITSGLINGKEISISTTGGIKILSDDNSLSFTGENIKLNGSIDGFNIKTLTEANGTVSLDKNTNKLDISKFKYKFDIEGITIDNNKGIFKEHDLGYELNLNGTIATDKNKVINLLQKFTKSNSVPHSTKIKINKIITNINEYINQAKLTELSYNNLNFKFDKNLDIQRFDLEINGVIDNTNINIETKDKNSTKVNQLNLDKIKFYSILSGNENALAITKGTIEFNLNNDIREFMKQELIKKFKQFGLKDIELEVSPNGSVQLKKATYEIFSTPLDKLGKELSNSNIPIISPLGRVLRLTDISCDLKLHTKIENNKLFIAVDDVTINQFFAFLSTKLTDAIGVTDIKAKVAETIQTKLKQILPETTLKGNILSIDLQKAVSKINSDITLTQVNISDTGEVKINFKYNTEFK